MYAISPATLKISNHLDIHIYNNHSILHSPPSTNLRTTNTRCLSHTFEISAIEAAQACDFESKISEVEAVHAFDYECKMSQRIAKSKFLKIAIVGFGNFGQFLAKRLVGQGHIVLAHSRTDYSEVARDIGVSFYSNTDDLCEEHPDVILLCTSILSTEKVLQSLPLQRLKRSTLFVDVLSVKEFSKDLFIKLLPSDFDILCTHPMFGPDSGKNSWKGLTFVYDKVRIGNDEDRISRCDKFLDSFAREGCIMKEMTCAEHDQLAAESQFITHTVGRILEKLELESTSINTKGYERLLDLVANTSSDSFELYYGLFIYNKNAVEQIERLDSAFESLKKELFAHLHEVLKMQMYGQTSEGLQQPPGLMKLSNGNRGHASRPESPALLKSSSNGNRSTKSPDLMMKLSSNGNGSTPKP